MEAEHVPFTNNQAENDLRMTPCLTGGAAENIRLLPLERRCKILLPNPKLSAHLPEKGCFDISGNEHAVQSHLADRNSR